MVGLQVACGWGGIAWLEGATPWLEIAVVWRGKGGDAPHTPCSLCGGRRLGGDRRRRGIARPGAPFQVGPVRLRTVSARFPAQPHRSALPRIDRGACMLVVCSFLVLCFFRPRRNYRHREKTICPQPRPTACWPVKTNHLAAEPSGCRVQNKTSFRGTNGAGSPALCSHGQEEHQSSRAIDGAEEARVACTATTSRWACAPPWWLMVSGPQQLQQSQQHRERAALLLPD